MLPEELVKRARELRERMTDAEQLLWFLLRNRRFCGFKFRRQHPLGRFILDFYCQELNLVVELDGTGHLEEMQRVLDLERTRFLESAGIRVVRFWNHEVLSNTVVVLEQLYRECFPSPGLWHPLPKGEGNSEIEEYPFSPREKVPAGADQGARETLFR